MYRVHKRKGSPYYWADISVPNPVGDEPTRIRQSTKKTRKGEALVAAATMEEAAMRRVGADKGTSDAVLAALEDAARLHAQGKLTLEKGRVLVAQMIAASSGGKMEFFTIRRWFEGWLEGRRQVVKESTFAQYSCHVGFLLNWLGDDAESRLESLTRSKLTDFRDALRVGYRARDAKGKARVPTPRKGYTVDLILTTVGAALAVAVKDGILLGNPADAVEPLGSEDSETREPFTAEEVEALFEAAPDREWRVLMFVAFYGGLRLMDAARLRWSNADLLKRTLKFVPRKTSRKKREVEIPLHPKLQAELEGLPSSDDPDALLLPTLGRNVRRDLCDFFPSIMEAAGVSRMATSDAKSGKRIFHQRSFHSFRHSLVTALHKEDVSPELRMKLLGQTSATVHQGYTHTDLATLANALEKLS